MRECNRTGVRGVAKGFGEEWPHTHTHTYTYIHILVGISPALSVRLPALPLSVPPVKSLSFGDLKVDTAVFSSPSLNPTPSGVPVPRARVAIALFTMAAVLCTAAFVAPCAMLGLKYDCLDDTGG